MLILSGNNLGQRHRDLNSKVSEAAKTGINFDEVKRQEDNCDAHKLFKVNLADKYKDINYILEILKSGDVFCITRALKCLWLYDDEYSNYINISYLKDNIFPHMSTKMERKVLTAIYTHLKNGERAIDFYKYCKETKMSEYAHKFLVFTTDEFKLDLMKYCDNFYRFRDSKFLKQLIGESFELAVAFIKLRCNNRCTIHDLRYLYSVSDEKYLDMLEKYDYYSAKDPNNSLRLGIRISKDILKNHRKRVIDRPVMYINKLNKNMLVKYLTTEDVKSLAHALLPPSSDYYWNIDYYHTYKFILEKIPAKEFFAFMKDIFTSSYPGVEFEMTKNFYELKYYDMLTEDEREAWALRHIERDEEWPRIENFMWYRFVSFSKAFSGIKQYIFLNPNKDTRSRIVNILPETARSQDDLAKIIGYYYQRHVNESESHKESFINTIIAHHDIYSFNEECWTPLDKLFYSLNVYTSESYERLEYKLRSAIYYILHDKELPDGLIEYIGYVVFYHVAPIIEELSEERNAKVANYLMNFFVEKIKALMNEPNDDKEEDDNGYGGDTIREKIDREVFRIWDVIYAFNRKHEECPEVAMQHMKSNMDYYAGHEVFKPKFIKRSEGDFMRWLKEDCQKAEDAISEIRCNTYRWNFRLCRLFRKLRVYFPNDTGKKYLEYFQNYLSDVPKGRREYRNIKMAVLGVLYLADEDFKNTFLEKNIPENPKIDHRNIDHRLLQVQKAICRLAYHSRPPLPLSTFRKFITGDYVHYCLPVFYNYLANSTSLTNFIESVIDAPLSIQKHGLRLAFVSYEPESLKPLIVKAWKRTKNVSLRKILFETLFYRILREEAEAQKVLYEVLKDFTTELNHDDHDDVYSLLVSDDLPTEFRGDFIETAWHTVSKLSDKIVDTNRKISVIRYMENHINLVQREFPRVQIIDEHVHDMLVMKKIKISYEPYHFNGLIESKWSLTVKYIVTFSNKAEQQRSLDLLNIIMTEALPLWNHIDGKRFVMRKFIRDFTNMIKYKDPSEIETCGYMVPVYQCILSHLQKSLKTHEIYLIMWELKLSVTCRKIMHDRIKNDGIAAPLVKKIERMIKKLLEKDEFYPGFYQPIADIITSIGNTIGNYISLCNIVVNHLIIEGLTEVNMKEAHVIAVMMLPKDPPHYQICEHKRIIANLRKYGSKEVQSLMYDKFVLSDYYIRVGIEDWTKDVPISSVRTYDSESE